MRSLTLFSCVALILLACTSEETPTGPPASAVPAIAEASGKSAAPVGGTAAHRGKVALCHRTGRGDFVRIQVAAPAVTAHLAHGDELAGGGNEACLPVSPGVITWIRQTIIGGIFCHCLIFTMNPDGSEQKPLVSSLVGNAFEFDWSPTGDKLAFTSDGPSCSDEGNRDIFTVNADGTGATRLTFTPAPLEPCDNVVAETTPSWSADGTRIAFTRRGHVWVMHADGTGQAELTPGASPRWSPVGDVIAFQGDQGRLYRINADGSNLRALSTVAVVGEQPVSGESDVRTVPIVWSPDGSRLAFVSSTVSGGDHQVFVVNENGSGETPLALGESPAWSPDGGRLAFQRARDLYRMNADGSDQTLLAGGVLPGSPAAWSPSGARLVVVRTAPAGIAEIWVMNADGTGLIQLTDPGEADMRDLVVDWRP